MANDIGTTYLRGSLGVLHGAGPVRPREAPRPTQDEGPARTREAERARESLDEAVSDVNELVHELQRELHFAVDKESGDTIIKVVDRATDEVVRQIPAEEIVRLRRRLEEAAGVLFQDSA